ncbi:MAG: T9SS type A sorting domain-containing protein [Saprospiraceae bacterium]|nr:T9SS type A sorting domain-containing protein [Saprospiraceae bacterium]
MKKLIYSSIITSIVICNFLSAQAKIKLDKIAGGLTRPILVTHAGDSRLFIVEQAGRIKILNNGIVEQELFLNITDRVNSRNNEQGLLGLAFHPKFKENGYIYVNYTSTGLNQTKVSRFSLKPGNPNKVDSLSENVIITIDQPYSNHNGGNILFGKDGYLYIGMGDGGSGGDPQNYSQNKYSLLGKMLRIDIDTIVSYKIPPTNPFVKNDSTHRPEIWALGLRNPWRFSFDRLTYDMWIGDVGQDLWEEIDFQDASSSGGENYGWKCYEGNANFNTSGCGPKNQYVFPVHQFVSDPNIAGCSVTGGHVYRGDKCSALYGKYIYGDFCSGKIWTITRVTIDSFLNEPLYTMVRNQLASFGEDNDGEVYICAMGANGGAGLGEILKIVDTSCSINVSSIVNHPSCEGKKDGAIFLRNESGADCPLIYEWSNGIKLGNLINLGPGKYSVNIQNRKCSKSLDFELKNKKVDSICITQLFEDEICKGDSALIIACDQFEADYVWYKNGKVDSTLKGKRIYVKESGNYQVKTVDMLGCESILSDTAKITVHPMPLKPVFTRNGDTLIATPGFTSYVWYKDNQVESSSTANYYVIKSKGVYCVQVIDTNQCRSDCSESMMVIPTSITNIVKERPLVLPNPSSGEFIFYLGDWITENSNLFIYNIEGKQVEKINLVRDIKLYPLNLNAYSSGHYYYKIESESVHKRIVSGWLMKY